MLPTFDTLCGIGLLAFLLRAAPMGGGELMLMSATEYG